MKELPRLDHIELNKWREKILGKRSSKFPIAFYFEQLFDERSILSKGKLFSERIEGLIKKFPIAKKSDELKAMLPKILKYLKDNDFLDETGYEKEYNKCASLILGKD